MKLRTKYIVFVTILHLITLVLSYFIFKENKILFIASEALIILSALLAWSLYKQLIQPLKTLMRGVEAIKDRDFTTKFAKTGKHEMDELIAVYNQMIDELRGERTRQEQQHFFLEKLIHTSPTGIIILDHDNRVNQLNPKAVQLLHTSEKNVVGKLADEIDHPVMQEISLLPSGASKTISLNGINTFKIQKSHFIDRGFARHFIMLEELTLEILAAEKKAYGKVIRMMAHEVNNTIGPVNSIINSTLQSDQLWQNGNETIQNALQVAAERNQNLNLFMRSFADVVRLPTPNKSKMDLNVAITSVATLYQSNTGDKQIDFILSLNAEPIYINADRLQIEQALLNIIKNAVEAIEGNGSITITTSDKPRQLIVTDTGSGIEKEIADQIFSPFFSTKKTGQGVGLTLIKEIFINHGYTFNLQSAGGKTHFTVTFEES